MRQHPVGVRRRRRRTLLGVVLVQPDRQPDRHHRHDGAGAVTTTAFSYPAAGRPSRTVSAARPSPPLGHHQQQLRVRRWHGKLTTITGSAQSQALTWNDAGDLASDAVTPSGGSAARTPPTSTTPTTACCYAADPGSTTLYLADEELPSTRATGTVTGTRYYSLGDSTVATTDRSQQRRLRRRGPAGHRLDRRRLGHPGGDPPLLRPLRQPARHHPAALPRRERLHRRHGRHRHRPDRPRRPRIPARTGSFITTDPLLNPDDPQDLNPYAYASDNPATDSDPTGASGGGPSIDGPDGCRGTASGVLACEANVLKTLKRGGHVVCTGSLNSPSAGFGLSLICKRAARARQDDARIYPRNKKGPKSPGFPGCPGDALSMLTGEIGTYLGAVEVKKGNKRGWLGVVLGGIDMAIGYSSLAAAGNC